MKQINFFKRISIYFLKKYKYSFLYYIIRHIILAAYFILYHFYGISKIERTFIFQKESYTYFYHPYDYTWKNERAVEIPIIRKIIEKYQGKKILEVGNVLSHYFPVGYEILDKYEKAPGVINQDIMDFQSNKKYDLIISISTLEHIEWENPNRILQVFYNLKKLLAPGGKLVVTLPMGYNPMIDELLKKGEIKFTKIYCLKRISKDNEWIEVSWSDICDAKYDYPFPAANGLFIGIMEN